MTDTFWEYELNRTYRALARLEARDDTPRPLREAILAILGRRHTHRAGTLAGLHIDECAICGRDLRHEVHHHD